MGHRARVISCLTVAAAGAALTLPAAAASPVTGQQVTSPERALAPASGVPG